MQSSLESTLPCKGGTKAASEPAITHKKGAFKCCTEGE